MSSSPVSDTLWRKFFYALKLIKLNSISGLLGVSQTLIIEEDTWFPGRREKKCMLVHELHMNLEYKHKLQKKK